MEDKPRFGTLIVTIKKATLTHDTELMGKMDPYVRIVVGKVQQKTAVKQDVGKTPVWNERFDFSTKHGELIDLTIWDKEDVMSDDFIGGAKIVVNADTMKDKKETWYPIFYGSKNNEKGGEILLEMEFTERDEKNVLVTMLEANKLELIQLQNNEKTLKDEIRSLRDKVNSVVNEKEQLKAQFQEEKKLLIQSFEGAKEGIQEEKANELKLISEISSLKESVRGLLEEKANLQKAAEKSDGKIKEMTAENESLKGLLKPKPEPKNKRRELEVVSVMIFGIYFVGSLLSKTKAN